MQVDANHLFPLPKRVLNERHPRPEEARVVDERVNRLKPFKSGIDDAPNIALFANVACATINLGVRTVITQLAHGCRNLLLIARADKHPRAFPDVRGSDGFADAASCPGD